MKDLQLINTLCESRVFRTKQSISKFNDRDKKELFYGILLSTIALAQDTHTKTWAEKYASQAAAFGNFDYFRTSGTDLYILTYVMQNDLMLLTKPQSQVLIRMYRSISRGSLDRSFIEQTLLRMERMLGITNTQLRNSRRIIVNWMKSSVTERKQAITRLHRFLRTKAKLAEVLPYLLILMKGEKGHFGKWSPLKKAAALGAVGLAGFALGYKTYDPNKRYSLKNSVKTFGISLTEDRPTQLLHIVQYLKTHPDVEKIISVHYISDGISAFVRTTDGNAYELEIRPAPAARSHKEKRGIKEGAENPLAKFGITALSDIIEQGDIGYSDDPVYMYWVEVPNLGSSGYFSQQEDAYASAREDYPYLIDDEHDDIHGVKEERSEGDPECWDCYDTGYTTEQHWEEKVNVPCNCKNSAEFRERFVQEDIWQWRCIDVLNEDGESTIEKRHKLSKNHKSDK